LRIDNVGVGIVVGGIVVGATVGGGIFAFRFSSSTNLSPSVMGRGARAGAATCSSELAYP
jgi:hypothetical protein